MSPALARRIVLLGAVTLLGAVGALAIAERLDGAGSSRDLPRGVPAPGGGWYEAVAGVELGSAYGKPTACGHVLERDSLGVSHPVLVCGAKIYLAHGRREILTQVVARGPGNASMQFGLTESLARALGVRGRTTIRWRFAGPER